MPPPLTTESRLIAPPKVAAATAAKFYKGRKTGAYTPADVANILRYYFDLVPASGLDPLLVLAQMSLETGFLTSAWSARPHRNPAGIGVTGVPGAGVSFPAWKVSARAHTGRLLAYALPEGKGSMAQRQLIAEALHWRHLPPAKRGSGPTVGRMARSWAADPKYAGKLVEMARRIQSA
jgi:hypothetical protein